MKRWISDQRNRESSRNRRLAIAETPSSLIASELSGHEKGARSLFVARQTSSAPEHRREIRHSVRRDTFAIDEAWLSSQGPVGPDGSNALAATLQDQEKDMIEAALAQSREKVAGPRGAVTKLGIPASTLESNIKQLSIEKRRFSSATCRAAANGPIGRLLLGTHRRAPQSTRRSAAQKCVEIV